VIEPADDRKNVIDGIDVSTAVAQQFDIS